MKILAVQNRMGIGDTIIFLPFIEAISKKYNTPVELLSRKSSKAEQYLNDTPYIGRLHTLDRNKKFNGRHDGVWGFLNLIKDLRKEKFDKIFIFNSSLRFNLSAKFSGCKQIFQYSLFAKKDQHMINTAKDFLKKNLNIDVKTDARIFINPKKLLPVEKKYKINKNKVYILLGIGGSGPSKRISPEIFISVIEKILKKKDCHFFLATGNHEEEKKILEKIMNSGFGKLCTPINELSINETLPIIKICDASVCNDTSFSHLSAALGVKTITLMADTPLMYGNYSPRMYPIIPEGMKDVNHHSDGKDKINPTKIYEKLIKILN